MLSSSTVINEKEQRTYYLPINLSENNVELYTSQYEIAAIRFVQKLGIRPHLNGYHLLIRAILLALESPDLLNSLSKKLYPQLAKYYGKNVKAVEHNMRKAIESAYEYDPGRIQSIFYYKVDKPYISEVLSIAVESIRYDLNLF